MLEGLLGVGPQQLAHRALGTGLAARHPHGQLLDDVEAHGLTPDVGPGQLAADLGIVGHALLDGQGLHRARGAKRQQ
ncbi:MAG TPA: hypothetical protein VHZ02_10205, partial [Acidimicrobiales bacterium]|nr:hypothetical protein [Acidimicrobiales bacterium]